MARKVKCFETKEWGTNETFYKAPDGHYYKSEDVYLSRLKRVEELKKINDRIAQISGYYDGMKFPTVVPRKLKELSLGYTYECIYDTIVECQRDIEYAFSVKEFHTEYQKFSYMMAIIVNNINDVNRKMKRDKKQEQIVNKQIENMEFEEMEQTQNKKSVPKKNTHDITDFLGDNLWN